MIYATGATVHGHFPVSANAFQKINNGANTFVTVLNPNASGSAGLVYSTFPGGSGGNAGPKGVAGGIRVGADGLIYVAGPTDYTDFPVTETAMQTSLNGPQNAFVSVIDISRFQSEQLVYSTYLGGSGSFCPTGNCSSGVQGSGDQGVGVGIGPTGNLYVAGTTFSGDFPVMPARFRRRPVQSAHELF